MIRGRLNGLGRLEGWFVCKHKQNPDDLSADDFAEAQHFYRRREPHVAVTAGALGGFLKAKGFLKPGLPLRRVKPGAWQRYRSLPIFGGVVDEFARWCLDRGFAAGTISQHLDVLRRLVPWFLRRGRRSLEEFSEEDIEAARRFYRVRKPWFGAGIGWLADMLKQQGRLKRKRPVRLTRSEREVARFSVHLREDCELAESTIGWHCFCVRRLLKSVGMDEASGVLSKINLGQIHAFVCRMSRHYARRTMPAVVATLRHFLRFEFTRGVLREPLHLRMDSVRVYREERLPRALPWQQLQRLLRLMDRSTPQGLRDFTVLLLAASYGLRRSEIAALTLDDIDWRARVLRLTQPKTGHVLLLPLTDEVARALVDYLQRGRPATTGRSLFLRVRPPGGPLGLNGVARCLKRAVRATGVDIQSTGFHALRHAFAMRLLRGGTPLKHISEVLGHRSFNTTSEYLRLDVEDLRQVALPAPKALSATALLQLGRGPAPCSNASSRKCRRCGSVTLPTSKGFCSFLAKPMRAFLALRRALGRGYGGEEWILRNLDFFLARHHPKGRVFTAAMFEGWAQQQSVVSPVTRSRWMVLVSRFCVHLRRAVPTTFLPDERTFPKAQPPPAPCILSQNDVARLLVAAVQKPTPVRTPEHPLRPHTMRLAVLLLYCCGLRRGELLKLRLADIDTEGQVLRINQTKFHKSRLVPLSVSVSEELQKYLQARRDYETPLEPSAPLLWSGRPNRHGGAFSPAGLRFNWRQICRYAGVLNHRGLPPRIHDLRHSFAVAVLQRAYDAGQNPQAILPRLARYMGHVGFQFTHHYLQFTEALRLAASERFRHLLAPILPPHLHHQTPQSRKESRHEQSQTVHARGSIEIIPRRLSAAPKSLQRQHHPQLSRQLEAAASVRRRQTRPGVRPDTRRSQRRHRQRVPRPHPSPAPQHRSHAQRAPRCHPQLL